MGCCSRCVCVCFFPLQRISSIQLTCLIRSPCSHENQLVEERDGVGIVAAGAFGRAVAAGRRCCFHHGPRGGGARGGGAAYIGGRNAVPPGYCGFIGTTGLGGVQGKKRILSAGS